MHELPLVQSIVDIAERHARENGARRILALDLVIGALCDAQGEWVQRYFRSVAAGTLAETALLRIRNEAASLRCSSCGSTFAPPGIRDRRLVCPVCGSGDCSLVAGLDWRLESIEVE